MLEMMEIGIDNAVAFCVSGKITERDMSLVLSEAKKKIEQYGNIVLFERIDSFEGIELSAIADEFEYIFKVGISNMKKAAVITDKKWIETIVNIEGRIFKNIGMKCFSTEDQDSAIEYLKNA